MGRFDFEWIDGLLVFDIARRSNIGFLGVLVNDMRPDPIIE
jgi:hypothetical protein